VISNRKWLNYMNKIGFIGILIILSLNACRTPSGLKEVDLSLTGLEMEFYEPPVPVVVVTNSPTRSIKYIPNQFPELMDMRPKKK
tara:strand:- start:1416 stop:1670 length:255 start_codon:yes stop_codon:yes gene_type:complete